MKAVVIHRHGGPEELVYEDIETPEIGPNDVLINLKAVGLNHFDLDVCGGISGYLSLNMPHVLGCEGAGKIAAETSIANREIFTLGYSTARNIGIGSYVLRLGQHKTKFGYENQRSSSRLYTVNRAEFDEEARFLMKHNEQFGTLIKKTFSFASALELCTCIRNSRSIIEE